MSGTGQQSHASSGSVAVHESLAGTGAVTHDATGNVAVALTLSGTGSVTDIQGAGSVAIAPSLSGTAQQIHDATGDVGVELALSGIGTLASNSVTGTGNVDVTLTLDGAGDVQNPGSVGGIAQRAGLQFKPIPRPKVEPPNFDRFTAKGGVGFKLSVRGTGRTQPQHPASGNAGVTLALRGVGQVTPPVVEIPASDEPEIQEVSSPLVVRVVPTPISGTGSVSLALSVDGASQLGNAGTGAVSLVVTPRGVGRWRPPVAPISYVPAVVVAPLVAESITAAPVPVLANAGSSGDAAVTLSLHGWARVWSPEIERQEDDDLLAAIYAAVYSGMFD